MKQDIENIIKKNLPEKKEKVYRSDGKTELFVTSNFHFNQALSQINTSLIADEVLNVVVEIGEKLKFNHKEGICYNCNCKIYDRGISDLLNLLTNSNTLEGERSEHLSPNKENENNEK